MQVVRERAVRMQQLQVQKQDLRNEIMLFATRNKIDQGTIQRLAQQHGIDFKAIRAKYERPKTSLEQKDQSHLPKVTKASRQGRCLSMFNHW
jgi:hypothetical protein